MAFAVGVIVGVWAYPAGQLLGWLLFRRHVDRSEGPRNGHLDRT